MRVLYFAWVKEKAGIAAEEIDPPETIATIAELIDWLKARGPEFAERLRALRGDPRGDRPDPCAARREDRRRARDRLLPAGDRRLMMIRVQQDDFDIGAEIAALKAGRSDIGAIVSFIGTVRDQQGDVEQMTLEHYPGMTEARAGAHRGRGARALAAASEPDRAPLRHAAARRRHRAGGDGVGASRGGVRGGEVPDGLSEDQRAVLEARVGPGGARWVEADAKDDSAATRWKKRAAE